MSTDGIAATSGDGMRQRENRTKSKDKMPSKASSRESSEEPDKKNSKSEKEKPSSRRKPKKTRHVVEDEASGPEEDMATVLDQEGNVTLHDGTMVVQPEPVDDTAPRAKQAASQSAKRVLEDLEVVSCSACNKQMNPNISGAVRRHPVLKVLICKKCYNWYASDEIDQDSDGMDEQCRWCGEGGNLLCCDYCHNAFCKGCIKRNLGRQALSELLEADEEEKWHCYVCNLKPLEALIQDANETLQRIEERRKLKKEQRDRAESPKPSGSKDQGKGGPFKSSSKRSLDLDTVRQLIPESLLTRFSTSTYETSSSEEEIPLDLLNFTLEKLYQSTKAQFEVLTDIRDNLSKLEEKNKEDQSVKEKKKLCTQLRHCMNVQKHVYSDVDIMFVNACNGPKKKKIKKRDSDEESLDNESCKKSMNGVASAKEKHDLKIRLSHGKIRRKSSSGDMKSVKKEAKKEVKMEVDCDVKSDAKEEDDSVMDVASILAGCGAVEASAELAANTSGMDHLLAEVDALNRSLSKEDMPQVNGETANDSDVSDNEEPTPKSSQSAGKSSRPSRSNIEAQRQLHKELLEESSDEDDEDNDDSEEDYLTSSSENSEEASSGEEYRPAELDKEKRDEKMERRRQRLQEKRNRRKLKAKETKAKNVNNSDEEEEEPEPVEKKKKGKKGKDGKKKRDDSSDAEKDSKKKKKTKDSEDKSSKKKKKSSKCDDSGDESEGESSKKKKEDKKGQKKGDKKAEATASDKEEEKTESGKKKKEKRNSKKDKTKKSETSDSEEEVEDKKVELEKKKNEKKTNKKAATKNSKTSDSEEEEDDDKNTDSQKQKNEKKTNKKDTAKKSKTSDSDEEDERELLGKKKNGKKGTSKKNEASDRDSDVEEMKKTDSGRKKTDKKTGAKKREASDSEEECNVNGEQGNKAEQGKDGSKGKKKSEKSADLEEINSEEEEHTKTGARNQEKKGKETTEKKANRNSKKGEKTKTGEDDSESEDLDKEIAELEKLPIIKKGKDSKVTKGEANKEGKTKDKAKSSSKRLTASERRQKHEEMLDELDADGSGVEEDEDEEEEEKQDSEDERAMAKAQKDADEAAGSDVNEPDDEDDEDLAEDLDEDSDIEELNKKDKKISKSKKSKSVDSEPEVMDVNSSDDEDGRAKKKTKKNKLLDEKLSDSDSDFETVPKKKKKGSKKESDDEDEVDDGSDSEPVVKKKRKRKKKNSDSSDDFVSDSDEDKPQAKKRKRVKKNSDSSAAEEEENEDDESPSKGRKYIRKIMKDKKLGDETKQAIKEEEDRRKRMAARQAEYNQITEEDSSPLKVPVTTKLVLEKDEDGDPEIEVDPRIIKLLKPHQVEAVKFMWDNVAETVERLQNTSGSGCILAHCMGLGKTLSVITLLHTLMTNVEKTKIKRVLCVTPLNTVLNWQNEFEKWVDEDDDLEVYELSSVKNNWSRADNLDLWHEGGGVMIVSYEMFRNLTQHRFTKNKKQKKIFTKTLADPGPDLVVCDEGHILKNDVSAVSKAMNLVKTKRRIVLTGTPLQNNLVEYHCMVNFVKPNLLGSRKEFSNMFVNPLVNGQCADSTPYDVRLMKKRAHILHEKLDGCVQRRDYSALTKFLPPKHEYVLAVKLSETQIKLYRRYLDMNVAGENAQSLGRGTRLFSDYQALMRIWTHPWVLKLEEVRRENNKKYDSEEETDEDDMGSFIDDSTSESEASFTGSSVEEASDEEGGSKKKKKDKKAKGKNKEPEAGPSRRSRRGNSGDSEVEIVKEWKTRSRKRNGESDEESIPEVSEVPQENTTKLSSEWWSEFMSEEDHFRLELSGKLVLLAEILRMSEAIGDKVLLFSQSLLSLDLIEEYLDHWDKQLKAADDPDDTPQIAGNQGWCHGLDYFRMDGSTQAHIRQRWAEIFNDPENIRARLFLISTKAGGLGINMVAANRVIIFDASWNPSHDVQSIFRVYRFGQTKPSYVYRFLAQGTMEEKIYSRQVTKQSLSQRVVDEHQIERHFTYADLKALYDFQPADEPTETPKLPKDLLLAELLASHRKWIVNYHEHDSLLENKISEDLTEEERKAAWEEFENEKKGILNHAAAGNIQQGQIRYPAMNNYATAQNYMAQQMPGGAYLDLARAIYQQNPNLNVTEVYQRVHQYIQMQMASRQQQQLLLQQQMQQQRKQQSELAKAMAMAEQQHSTATTAGPRHPLYSLLSHIKSPAEPN